MPEPASKYQIYPWCSLKLFVKYRTMWSLMKFNTGCFSPALEQMTFLGWMPDRVIDLKTLCKRKICAFKQQSHSQHGKMFIESILSFPRPTTHLYFPTSLAHRCGHIHWVVCSSWMWVEVVFAHSLPSQTNEPCAIFQVYLPYLHDASKQSALGRWMLEIVEP